MNVALAPLATLWEWAHEGLCRLNSPEIFFHPEGERGPARRWREARAVAICHQCPVLRHCREHALGVGEHYGVWGGMTEHEREIILGSGVTEHLGSRVPRASPRASPKGQPGGLNVY